MEPEPPPSDVSPDDFAAILLRKDRRSITDLVTGSFLVYVPSS